MAISPARLAAFNILLRVERESAYAVELLHSPLVDELPVVDRHLAMELVMGVLRWRSVLDHSIAELSFTPFRKLDLEVLTALRMGVYQKRFLTRIPAHAAVNETVELVKQAKKASAAGLVNAVMRKVKPGFDPHESKLTGADYLAAALAHPRWLVERWIENLGYGRANVICEYDQRVPATVLRLNAKEAEDELVREGIQLAPGALMKTARVVKAGDVTAASAFRAGKVAIQDEASQLVAALMGDGGGRRILDCCAAPGGKTGALAARWPDTAIFAAELHPHRARLLRRLAPQSNVHVVAADALHLPFAGGFDRVLADVPCSGTGTLARNPEIKWRLRPGDLQDLQARQIAILRAAMGHAVPGGRVVYSTCSLEREENEDVVAECLRGTADFAIIPVQDELERLRQAGELVCERDDQLVSGQFLRTIPGVPGDGFFAAMLARR